MAASPAAAGAGAGSPTNAVSPTTEERYEEAQKHLSIRHPLATKARAGDPVARTYINPVSIIWGELLKRPDKITTCEAIRLLL